MSARDPLIQAERRCEARNLGSKQVGLFPCRGSVVPCRTLPLVSATCHGTVKLEFRGDIAPSESSHLQTTSTLSPAPALPCNSLAFRRRETRCRSLVNANRGGYTTETPRQ